MFQSRKMANLCLKQALSLTKTNGRKITRLISLFYCQKIDLAAEVRRPRNNAVKELALHRLKQHRGLFVSLIRLEVQVRNDIFVFLQRKVARIL